MSPRFAAVFMSLLLSACGDGATSAVQKGVETPAVHPTKRPGMFDPLTIRLELKADSVPSGGQVGAVLIVSNNSGRTVVDPDCRLGAGRYALVPVDDPGAELWLQPVVDCSGPFEMPDGFSERYGGKTFPARTKFGDALPPGDYIAALEIQGFSERLEQPVEVTD